MLALMVTRLADAFYDYNITFIPAKLLWFMFTKIQTKKNKVVVVGSVYLYLSYVNLYKHFANISIWKTHKSN